jgi:hypothetical protein
MITRAPNPNRGERELNPLRIRLVLATLVVLLAGMAVLVGGRANVALGDPNLPNITPHRHFILNGGRLVQVGPRVCDDPSLQSAFNQFHSNIHVPLSKNGKLVEVA